MKLWNRMLAVLATAAAFTGLAGMAQAQEKSSVAVLEIRPTDAVKLKTAREGGRKQQSLDILLDSMRAGLELELVNTKKFRVIAHKDLEQIMEKVSMEQVTADPSDPALAQEFKNAAVEFVVIVDVELFTDEFATLNVRGASAEKRTINVAGTSKLYHIESGELISGKKYRSDSKKDGKQINPNIRSDGGPRGDELLIEFADELGASLAQRVMDEAFPIKVLRFRARNGELRLNRRDDGSIKVGDILDVFMAEELIDPDTGDVFLDEYEIAQARVTRVSPAGSSAELIGDDWDERDFEDTTILLCRKVEEG